MSCSLMCLLFIFFFFFSSRRRHTRSLRDWSSDVCSSDLPGTIGTNHSMPRLTKGQGAIIGVGAMEYPAQYQGTSEKTLTDLAVSKIMTLTFFFFSSRRRHTRSLRDWSSYVCSSD